MAWRHLLTQVGSVTKHSVQSSSVSSLGSRVLPVLSKLEGDSGIRLQNLGKRLLSSYVGNLARRARDIDGANEAAIMKELYRNDPEAVIRFFESRPSLQSNPVALAEYLKALVKVDRLDDSALLKTLQRGDH